MRWISPILVVAILLTGGCWRAQNSSGQGQLPRLELVAAYSIDVPAPLEPSGLVLWEGTLYTVADKDNRTIYRVEISDQSAQLVPAVRFDPPAPYSMDWEGISVDANGNFHLISENWGRILRVSPSGQSSWAIPDQRQELAKAGLFAKSNAGFEGITVLGPDHWLGAVEREPRGLVEMELIDGRLEAIATLHEHSPFSNALPLLRLPDFSGLDMDGDALFALFRNAHLVVRLERDNGSFTEAEGWSYRHIETDPRFAYRAQAYGQAEGLVVHGRDVYLIFDNNLGPRQGDPNDGRPLLVHARFPEAP
jgi:hypothetical protein